MDGLSGRDTTDSRKDRTISEKVTFVMIAGRKLIGVKWKMENKSLVTKKICFLAMGIALYVVLSTTVNIPLIGHIRVDAGYLVFGAFISYFGITGTVVGVVGCLIESLLFSGWIPVGWMFGQFCVGVICGDAYKRIQRDTKSTHTRALCYVIMTALAVFIGILFVKTGIECSLYDIPFLVKAVKNLIAAITDTIMMSAGVLLAERFRKKVQVRMYGKSELPAD